MQKERPHFSQRRCISSPALAYSHESCQHETSFSTISQLSLPRELSFFPEITAPATAAAPDRTRKTSAFWDPRNYPCQSVHPHKKEKVDIKLTGWLVTVFRVNANSYAYSSPRVCFCSAPSVVNEGRKR